MSESIPPYYWAEAAAGQHYPKQNMRTLSIMHRTNLLMCLGAACAAAVISSGVGYAVSEREPRTLRIVTLQMHSVPPTTHAMQAMPVKRASLPAPAIQKPAPSIKQVPAPVKTISPPAKAIEAPVNVKIAAVKQIAAPAKVAEPAKKMPERVKSPQKPIDMADANKFGLQSVQPNAIILLNGKRIAIGEYFPNGETLMRVDMNEGVVETNRRIMMVMP